MQKKLVVGLLLTLIFIGTLSVGLKISHVSAAPVVDGVISPGEYDGAMLVQLVGPYPAGAPFPPQTVDCYIHWDLEYLWIAVDEPVPVSSGTQSWTEFCMDAGPSRPVWDAWVLFGNGMLQYVACPKPSGSWGWASSPFPWSAATNTATEFQIKYTDYGIAYGDTIRLVIDRGRDDFLYAPFGDCIIWPPNPIFYPSVTTADVATWGEVTLGTPPPPSGHVVDGAISPDEYEGGMSVVLVGRTDTNWTVDGYIDWDDQYLYVAVNESVPNTTGHKSWIEFAIDPGSASAYLYAFVLFDDNAKVLDRYVKPLGLWSSVGPGNFSAVSGAATEFKVKYTDFGIALGDTIKLAIDRNQGPSPPPPYGFAAFWPQNATVYYGTPPAQPVTWGDVTLGIPPPPPGHVVDGIIGSGEYDGGMGVVLVGRTDPNWTVDGFIDWDGEYLYVAVDEPVPPGTGTQSWIEFCFDAGPSRSYLDAFVLFCSGQKQYVRCPKPPGSWGWQTYDFLAATDTATEFKVKYTDFGIALGDTMKLAIDRNQGPSPPPPYGFAAFWPQNATVYDVPPVPATWGDVTLSPPVTTELYIDPPVVTKTPADIGGTFNVSVEIKNVTDLFGFDINITWDNTLITFASLYKTALDTIWPQGYFEPLTPSPQTGPGYFRFAALATGGSGFTGSGTLFVITFNIIGGGTVPQSTLIHFNNVELSDSGANPIDAVLTDGQYNIGAGVRDVAVTQITPSKTTAVPGDMIDVNVTTANLGNFIESFNVTLLYNTTQIAKTAVNNLGAGLTQLLTFHWNTTGLSIGSYNLTATADTVPGETNTLDNTKTYPQLVKLTPPITLVMKVEPPAYHAKSLNETFQVNITLYNVTSSMQLAGFEFKLGYNSTMLELLQVSNGSFLEAYASPPNGGMLYYGPFVGTNEVLFAGLILPDVEGIRHAPYPSGNGVIATLTFRVKYQPIGIPQPNAECSMTLINTKLADGVPNLIPHSTVNGFYDIVPTPLGDLNFDGIVDIYDAIIFANSYGALAPPPADPRWNPYADLNKDGTIDIYDAILVANHFGEQRPDP